MFSRFGKAVVSGSDLLRTFLCRMPEIYSGNNHLPIKYLPGVTLGKKFTEYKKDFCPVFVTLGEDDQSGSDGRSSIEPLPQLYTP